MSLNIAAGLHLGGNESYPDVFKPFGGFADGIAVENGYVGLPDVPGVGFEAKSELIALMRTLTEDVTLASIQAAWTGRPNDQMTRRSNAGLSFQGGKDHFDAQETALPDLRPGADRHRDRGPGGSVVPARRASAETLADGFIKLIKMLLAPIIFGTVVVGMAKMGDLKEVGRIGVKALVYFEVLSTIALVIGLVVVNILKPGAGMNIDASNLDGHALAGFTEAAKEQGVVSFLMDIIPTTLVDAFAKGAMLQVILLSTC